MMRPLLCLLLLFAISRASEDPSHPMGEAGRSNFSALCAVARDENLYLREWALYHLCLGGGIRREKKRVIHTWCQWCCPRMVCYGLSSKHTMRWQRRHYDATTVMLPWC